MRPGEQPSDMGANRTGIQMSPKHAREMEEASSRMQPGPGDEEQMARLRERYQSRSIPVGTMPLPGSLKGAAKAAGKALKGQKPTVFLDKLGERMAFERSGVRLYDAMIAKLRASGEVASIGLTVGALQEIRTDELRHMQIVVEAIEGMGADPTAETPCADVSGVEALGLVQVLTDPRTTVSQGLSAILTAELVDNASWEMLVDLSRALGSDELAERFEVALREEQEHLRKVRGWAEGLIRGEAQGMPATS